VENRIVGELRGYVVHAADVEARCEDGDTATTRLTIDRSTGAERLEQRELRFAPGRSRPRRLVDAQELLYVASGHGTIELEGTTHELTPETGVFVTPGETYVIDNPGPDELLMVSVRAPVEHGVGPNRKTTVRWADRPTEPATAGRDFRYLVNQDAGCLDVTQFVGRIPVGRAPDHHHTYDEVVYVVEGNGYFHIGDERQPIGPGSCIHLPPYLTHCLENAGPGPMRVLGVFHPSGSPAEARVGAANR
jgi:mannose-6-phosphate isomerase-like protein (cupin superfamily)